MHRFSIIIWAYLGSLDPKLAATFENQDFFLMWDLRGATVTFERWPWRRFKIYNSIGQKRCWSESKKSEISIFLMCTETCRSNHLPKQFSFQKYPLNGGEVITLIVKYD